MRQGLLQFISRQYPISTAYVQLQPIFNTYPNSALSLQHMLTFTPHIQPICRQYPIFKPISSQSVPILQPMTRQYPIFTVHLQTVSNVSYLLTIYSIHTAHSQTGPHLYRSCSMRLISTPLLSPVYTPCHVYILCPQLHVMPAFHLYIHCQQLML